MAGRNNSGKITVRHKGGGHKNKYRKINFQRTQLSTGIVCSMEHDPNRNSIIGSIFDFFTHNSRLGKILVIPCRRPLYHDRSRLTLTFKYTINDSNSYSNCENAREASPSCG